MDRLRCNREFFIHKFSVHGHSGMNTTIHWMSLRYTHCYVVPGDVRDVTHHYLNYGVKVMRVRRFSGAGVNTVFLHCNVLRAAVWVFFLY